MERRYILYSTNTHSEPSNIIYYTSSDNNIVTPYKKDFGSTLVSNTYSEGQGGTMTFSENVKYIGYRAFEGCSTLTNITIPISASYIDGYAFDDCVNLDNIVIPGNIKKIGLYAFWYCSKLKNIDIQFGVEVLGVGAFSQTSINNPNLPNSIKLINRSAFSYCLSLTKINIPSSVTEITGKIFYYSKNLSKITVDPLNTVYDSRNNCNAIIETASKTLIEGCKNTTIPSSVIHIGNDAFQDVNLYSFNIPNTIQTIGRQCFYQCPLSSITVGNNVSSIGRSAFAGCNYLPTITLPNSITSIGGDCFANCNKLRTCYIKANTPPTTDNTIFRGTSITNIYVPSGSEEAYKSAAGWSNYADKIVPYNF